MTTTDDVKKLAALARISIPDGELEAFAAEFDAILAYVGQLDAATKAAPDLTGEKSRRANRNRMRADGEPHAAGIYTEKLAEQFPAREGDALLVKQVITYD